MTGLWPARVGITWPECHSAETRLEERLETEAPPTKKTLNAVSATRLKLEYVTVAESLKAAGYKTAHYGKWHLGRDPYDPMHQGFDIDIPHTCQGQPPEKWLPGPPWPVWPRAGTPGEHIDEGMAKEAAKFITENKDRPFYVNFCTFSVHAPWQAKEDLIQEFAKKADPASLQRNPVYAAMISSMDNAIGMVLRALDEAGVARQHHRHLHVGQRRLVLAQHPIHGRAVHQGAGDEQPAVARGETHDLRGRHARTSHCRVAGQGPAGLEKRDGHRPVDRFPPPPLLEMCAVKAPAGAKFDGISFVPALAGMPLAREAIFCHHPHENNAAAYEKMPGPTPSVPATYVRNGNWKLIRFYCDNPDRSDCHELYNLKDDLGETKDLAAAMPEKVKELSALIDQFLKESGAVVPKANPALRPQSEASRPRSPRGGSPSRQKAPARSARRRPESLCGS